MFPLSQQLQSSSKEGGGHTRCFLHLEAPVPPLSGKGPTRQHCAAFTHQGVRLRRDIQAVHQKTDSKAVLAGAVHLRGPMSPGAASSHSAHAHEGRVSKGERAVLYVCQSPNQSPSLRCLGLFPSHRPLAEVCRAGGFATPTAVLWLCGRVLSHLCATGS